MVDIIDVILGKALTPQGQAASAAAAAQTAAQSATQAATQAQSAAETAQTTAETAQSTLDTLVEQIDEIISNVEGGVLYNAVQNLTEAEKAQARDNIGALDVSDFHELLVRHSIGAVTTRALRIDPIFGTFNDRVGTLKNADTENGEIEYYARGQEVKLRPGAEYTVTPGYEFRFYTYTPETAESRPNGLGWLMDWTTSYTAESDTAIRPTFRKTNGEPMTNPSAIQLFIRDATLDYINNSIELGSVINITGNLNYGRFLCRANATSLSNNDCATTRYIPVKQGDSLLINALWQGTKYNDYRWMGLYGYDENYRFVRCLLDMESAYGWVSLNHLEENSVVLDYYLFKVPAGISYVRTSSIYQNKPAAIEPQIFKFLDSAYLDINLRGDQINLGPQNANKIVIVNTDGTLTSSTITQQMLINGVDINPDTPVNPGDNPIPITGQTGTLGIRINYDNGTVTPTDDLTNSSCAVNNEGQIIAFAGEAAYNEDPANGYQIMVYQPKFYYNRQIIRTAITSTGTTIIKEELLQISAVEKDDFKLHPLFIDTFGNELEYVLLSAYEGSIQSEEQTSYEDIKYTNFLSEKLSSVASAFPITGSANLLNAANAQQLAENRGGGWHILTSKAISAQQMLAIIEFNTLNLQSVIGKGVSEFSMNDNCFVKTGSTGSLRNITGAAQQTIVKVNNNDQTYTTNGKVAISYRGYENPWGSLWQIIGDLLSKTNQDTTNNYSINNNYNYTDMSDQNYINLSLKCNKTYGWISNFGYNNEYDWLYLPAEMESTASSMSPVGDYFSLGRATNQNYFWIIGGSWSASQKAGLFCYGCDREVIYNLGERVNARLIYIPIIDTANYNNNIIKWNSVIGG